MAASKVSMSAVLGVHWLQQAVTAVVQQVLALVAEGQSASVWVICKQSVSSGIQQVAQLGERRTICAFSILRQERSVQLGSFKAPMYIWASVVVKTVRASRLLG